MSRSEKDSVTLSTPIAIVGMGCLFPNAQGLHDYWRLIRWSEDGVREVPSTHWLLDDYYDPDRAAADRVYCRRGGFLSPTMFDPLEYGIPPAILEATDTAQLLGLVVAKMALEDAGYGAGREFNRHRTGVVLGVTGTQELVIPLGARLGHPIWRRALERAGVDTRMADEVVREIGDSYVQWKESSFPGLLGNVVAGRIANRLDLRGTNCVVDAACASSLSALHLAMLELSAGRADMLLAGGVDTLNDIFMFMCFAKTQALSPTGDARPFSDEADGTVIGEGVGMLVLKRLADAERDGDRIYAVIRGLGTSSDGRSESIYAPRAEGQAEALRNAYRYGGIEPRTIELLEAHGTGTIVGDVVEFEALRNVFRENQPEGTWCALGSVKSQIGHTKAAAGVASLIKAVLALHHKVLPATIKVKKPNAKLQIDHSPFYLSTQTRPWMSDGRHPRRAGVSAFGFGGSNFHVVLEEYTPGKREPAWDGAVQIVPFAAATREELIAKLEQWIAALDRDWSEQEWAYHAALSRNEFPIEQTYRLVLVFERDTDRKQLFTTALDLLKSKSGEDHWSQPNIFFGSGPASGEIAFVFPGQGSQYLYMGRDLVCLFPEAHAAIAEADTLAADGERLSDLLYPQPTFDAQLSELQKKRLTGTDVAQPAIGAVSLAMLRVLESFGVHPAMVGGHSFGELVALRAAGRYDDTTLHRLAQLRGRLMAKGDGGRGAMLAVHAPLNELDKLLADAKLEVVLANRNTPNQGVLSGDTQAIEQATELCTRQGWKCTRLRVSGAFHSVFMADAGRRFREVLEETSIAAGERPVYANRSAEPYPEDAGQVRDLLAGQLTGPVRFVEQIENMYAAGARVFVEVGPGKVLTGLIKAILGDRPHRRITLDASVGRSSGIADLAKVLAQLAADGRAVQLNRWERPAKPPVKAKMAIPLLGTNYRVEKPKVTTVKPAGDQSKREQTIPPSSARVANGNTLMNEQPKNDRPAQGGHYPSTNSDPLVGIYQVVQEGLRAMQALQQQTAAAHQRFLETQETAHKTFQMVMEQQNRLMERVLGLPTTPLSTQPSIPSPQPSKRAETSVNLFNDVNMSTPAPVMPTPSQTVSPPIVFAAMPSPSPSEPAPQPETKAADSGMFEQILLSVVAELTGYPAEMLNADMDLEADLGIDSIKRVEILAAVQSRLPTAKAVDSAYMGSLRTLRNIMEYMDGTPAVEPVPAPTQAKEPVAAQPIARPEPKASQKIERRVLRAVELPATTEGKWFIPADHEILITNDGTELAAALVSALKDRGVKGRVIKPDEHINGKVKPPVGGLIHLGRPLEDTDAVWSPEAEARLKQAFILTKKLGPRLRTAGGKGGALLATVSRMDGRFGLDGTAFDAVQGGLAGLLKTAAHEWPEVRCKALDVDANWQDTRTVAEAIVRELTADGPVEIGLRETGRYGLELFDEPAPTGELQMQAGDVVIVTGGARGVTAEAAALLAETTKATLILLGRSPCPTDEPIWLAGVTDEAAIKRALLENVFAGSKPAPAALEAEYRKHQANRQVRETLARITAAGGQAVYRSVDVRDAEAVAATLDEVRRSIGPIRGLIHGAGVLEDHLIEDKTIEQFEKVFDTKVQGLRGLLNALNNDELEFMVLFSSVSGRFGRVGQIDYAMANEALNKIAQRQRTLRPGCRVVAINWGPWDGGMVTPALKREFERLGIGLIPLDIGAKSLLDELRVGQHTSAEVIIGGSFPQAMPARHSTPQSKATTQGSPGNGQLTTVLERTLDLDSHPFLASHVIGGHPVLPVAMMIEWFAHAAMHGNPGLMFNGLDDLRVFRGVILNNGPRQVRIATSSARRESDLYAVDIELHSRGNDGPEVLNARARVWLADRLPEPPTYTFDAKSYTQTYPRSVEAIYDDVLFHGPHFHAVEKILGHSPAGMAAEMKPAASPGEWMSHPLRTSWIADPRILDGALQLGVLWGFERLGCVSLPSFGGQYRQYCRSFPNRNVRLVMEVRESGEHRIRADIAVLDDNGRLLARLENYQWTADSSLGVAFGHDAVVNT